jgi:IclR family acetate operon transcriptional repressor
LEAVAKARRPVSLAELTPILGLDRSSVFRLANTLRLRGFLAQVSGSKEYVLGSAVWRLSSLFRFSDSLMQLAKDYVNALAAEVGETTHLAIREGREAVLIDHQLTDHPVGVSAGSGFSVPLHCTSVGKALLVDCDLPKLVAIFGKEPLQRLTSRTLVSLDAVADDCRQTRRRGYSLDDEEHHKGVRCIGAPIRDAGGEVVASIGVSAPAERFPKARLHAIGALVVEFAGKIACKLGAASDDP